MQHRIDSVALRHRVGPQIDEMAAAVAACVHCGFCLPTCPTYVTLGEEMDSPRGRIVLMKAVLEGELDLDAALAHLDPCLGCEACVTACPSGVAYGELLVPFRAFAESERRGHRWRGLRRGLLLAVLERPHRLRALVGLGLVARAVMAALPPRWRPALELLPERLPRPRPLPPVSPAVGKRRARVALLAGCAQRVLKPQINVATIAVLNRNGVEVWTPPGQGCCGSLALHAGASRRAARLAERNLAIFADGVDAVVINAAGCGSGMHAYPLLFKEGKLAASAHRIAERTRDVSSFLVEIGIEPPPALAAPLRVAYHDACHLAHAQRERVAPRALLDLVPNLTRVEPDDWEVCCGSAGIYNLEQPAIARELGERKARRLLDTDAEVIVTGNVGCALQIESHLRRLGEPRPVLHTVELLERAYRGAPPTAQ